MIASSRAFGVFAALRLGDPRHRRVREPVLGDRIHRGVDELLTLEVSVISLAL